MAGIETPRLGSPSSSLTSGQNKVDGSTRASRERAKAADVENAPERAASRVQQESQRQIRAANDSVQEAQRESNDKIDQIRDQYTKSVELERAAGEVALERVRQQGYEQLAALKKQQQAELRRTRREGEHDLTQLQDTLKTATHSTEKRADEEISLTRNRASTMLDIEAKNARQQLDQQKASQHAQSQNLRDDHEFSLHEMNSRFKKEYDNVKESTETARKKAFETFDQKFQNTVKSQQETLNRVSSTANRKIGEIRTDTAEKLAAYATRQGDPFYKLMRVDADLADEGVAFVLQARIPTHEQDQVSVTIQGDSVVLSGRRRNKESMVDENGKRISSESFQTYSESFPLDFPVAARQLSRSFDGETLTVLIPKRAHAGAPRHKAPERAKVERPHFPDNLPLLKRGEDDGSSELT